MPTTRSTPALAMTSMVVVAPDQVSSDLAGEAVILNLRTGMYYGLNPVGARIWMLLSKPMRVADVRDAIMRLYEVDGDRCERDVLAVLHQLARHGLIEIRDVVDP